MPMSGNLTREPQIDWGAAAHLDRLMADRGWNPRDVERASRKTGNPARRAHYRTIYRVLSEGHKPTRPVRNEIARALGVAPSMIWRDPNGAAHDDALLAA